METVTHREMRNQSAEVLRRVEAGESFIVTNNGRPVAVLSPVGRSVLDELADLGQVRRATRKLDSLKSIQRRPATVDSARILDDTRGAW
ncbi:MAG TPA: type II toxin-antitoxin system prevent-host-death family antitoxin [Aldersonia sp.]